MKKYIFLSFLFLLTITPVFARGSQVANQGDTSTIPVKTNTITPIKNQTITPTGNQVKNQNEVQTKNQGEDQQLNVQNQENEQLNQTVNDSFTKVSDQVHELINTVGAKGGIGEQVREIAQNQTKIQDEIQFTVGQINSRSNIAKFFLGSDKKMLKNMEQQIEQNQLMIQQLEELKLQTKNSGDLQQLQETINLMINQNTSLQEKFNSENKINGMFGWLVNLFNR